ncbi:MAG: hypothetical protein ACRDJM_04570 [Actinomycetota bacterium]
MVGSRILVGIAAVAAIATGLVPASAQGATVCTFESDVEISPGVTPEPTNATFRTPEPGTITCMGGIEGTGTIEYGGVTGIIGENCALDVQGSGTLTYTIGATTVTGTFEFTRVGLAGEFVADTSAGPLAGLFQFQPAEGQDCVTTPVTEAHVTGQAVVATY